MVVNRHGDCSWSEMAKLIEILEARGLGGLEVPCPIAVEAIPEFLRQAVAHSEPN